MEDEQESVPDSAEITVSAWLGNISSQPEGNQLEDFLILSLAGAGEFSLTDATPETEAEIRAL